MQPDTTAQETRSIFAASRSNRARIISALQALPDRCAAYLVNTRKAILIVAGEQGYYPMAPGFDAKAFNERQGITPAQVNAMVAGSCFGWHCAAADPANDINTDPRNDPYSL